jgi:hypothetical protein
MNIGGCPDEDRVQWAFPKPRQYSDFGFPSGLRISDLGSPSRPRHNKPLSVPVGPGNLRLSFI